MIYSLSLFFFRSLFRLPSFLSAVKFGHFCETMIWLDIYMYVCIHVSLDHDWNSRTFSYRRVRLRLFMIKRSAQSTPLVICLWKTHVSFPFNPFHLRIAVFLSFFFFVFPSAFLFHSLHFSSHSRSCFTLETLCATMFYYKLIRPAGDSKTWKKQRGKRMLLCIIVSFFFFFITGGSLFPIRGSSAARK